VTADVGGMTICDDKGDCLVVERWNEGHITVWIGDRDGVESRSVLLNDEDRRSVAAYLIEGLK